MLKFSGISRCLLINRLLKLADVNKVSSEAVCLEAEACDIERSAGRLAVAASPWEPTCQRQLIADFELCQLFRYPSDIDDNPLGATQSEHSKESSVILIIYAMVNTASILDLGPDMSTIERLREQGLTVYLMEWKAPQSEQSAIGFDDYLEQSVHCCVNQVREDCQLDKVNLMGVCQGGVLSLCYASLYPGNIRTLIPVVTPVDCQTKEDILSSLARYLDLDTLVLPGLNIPGVLLAQVFLSLKPMTLTIKKYMDISVRLSESGDCSELTKKFMAMEQWIEETPDQPAQFFKEFVSQIYQKNALYNGSLKISGVAIDLQKLTVPVLNIYASKDHLVPPESSKALALLVDEEYYQSLEVRTGHIGMFVSKKSLKQVPKAIADFIRQPDPLWSDGQASRSSTLNS